MSDNRRNTRRDFLSWLGLSSVVAATGTALSPSNAKAESLIPIDTTWDVSWTDRVNGKFKAVFDCPQVEEGSAMFRACIWRDQHKAVYGTPRSDTSPVLVVRHAAMAMIMNDEYWNRFEIGKEQKIKNAKGKWERANPYRAAAEGSSGAFKEYNMTDFMAAGGIVLGCGLAFNQVIGKYRKADKLSREDADKIARQNMIPGVILQPSGIFAVLRAQEMGCNYIMAS